MVLCEQLHQRGSAMEHNHPDSPVTSRSGRSVWGRARGHSAQTRCSQSRAHLASQLPGGARGGGGGGPAALTGVVEGDLVAARGGPGTVVHRSSLHDVRLRRVGFGGSHQHADPAEQHAARSAGGGAGGAPRRQPPHSPAGLGDVEIHRVAEVAAGGPAVHRQLLLVQVESHRRR